MKVLGFGLFFFFILFFSLFGIQVIGVKKFLDLRLFFFLVTQLPNSWAVFELLVYLLGRLPNCSLR